MALSKITNTSMADTAIHGRRNLIINGAMIIDQRNSGSSVTINSGNETYVTDRFICRGETSDGVFTAEQDTTTPDDFKNSFKITVTTADSSIGATQSYLIRHRIEGQNISYLNWGFASAQKCTLSFYVRSSVTGTFGGSFNNSAFNKSYPFTYTISTADTWERKVITVDGPTDGTWVTDNGNGIIIGWSLGAGSSRVGTAGAWASTNYQGATGQTNLIATNSSTFYITGIQLEVGEQATLFEHRSYGEELALCQRYFIEDDTVYRAYTNAPADNGSRACNFYFPTIMRAAPSMTAAVDAGTVTFSSRTINGIAMTIGGSVSGNTTFTSGYTADAEL